MGAMRPNLFSWLVAAFLGIIFVMLAYETFALFTGGETITDFVRPAVRAFPGWAFAGAIVVGITVGHFLWGPASGPTSPGDRPPGRR